MSTNTHNGRWSHRLGRGAGRAWRGYLRREQRVAGWLVTRGVPAGAATAVLWIVKLAVLGALLYSAFWLALLLAIARLLHGSCSTTTLIKRNRNPSGGKAPTASGFMTRATGASTRM